MEWALTSRDHITEGLMEKIFFSSDAIMADNHSFTLNANNFITRLVRLRWISLLVALFFLSGQCANADPVGDFFKRVGQSVSKAFQPQPQPAHPQTEKTRVSRRATSRKSNAAAPQPSAPEETPQAAKAEKSTSGMLPASAAPVEKAKEDMPYGIPVPGRKGMVTSPYLPEGNYIDVSAFAPGSAVKDPYTGKLFRVP
jgi:hypothetical protein